MKYKKVWEVTHIDISMCGIISNGSILVLYGIALATKWWGVVVSLEIHLPFVGAIMSTISLIVAYGFVI
jgi:hypothetical protein